MSALVLQPPLSAPARRRHLALVPPPREARPARPAPRCRPARTTRARPGPLHVTRRGRLALTLSLSAFLLVATGALVTSALAAPVQAPAAATAGDVGVAAAPAQSRVVVLPGDTLWSIADEVALPGEDVRDVVLRIQEINEMPSAALAVGDVLAVPA